MINSIFINELLTSHDGIELLLSFKSLHFDLIFVDANGGVDLCIRPCEKARICDQIIGSFQ